MNSTKYSTNLLVFIKTPSTASCSIGCWKDQSFDPFKKILLVLPVDTNTISKPQSGSVKLLSHGSTGSNMSPHRVCRILPTTPLGRIYSFCHGEASHTGSRTNCHWQLCRIPSLWCNDMPEQNFRIYSCQRNPQRSTIRIKMYRFRSVCHDVGTLDGRMHLVSRHNLLLCTNTQDRYRGGKNILT